MRVRVEKFKEAARHQEESGSTETNTRSCSEAILDCTSTLGFRYSVFGLLLHSNVPLHGVVPADPLTNHTDIEVLLGPSPYRTTRLLTEDEKQICRSSDFLPP